jgi:hypothetical protein
MCTTKCEQKLNKVSKYLFSYFFTGNQLKKWLANNTERKSKFLFLVLPVCMLPE